MPTIRHTIRHTVTAVAATLLATAALAACKRDSKAATGAPAAAAATDNDHHAAAVDRLQRLAEEDPSAAASMQTLAGRLQYEVEHRPAAAIPAETVFAALDRAGLPVTDGPRQYVAVVAGAGYCAGGATADGLGVAVCEYASADQARAGKAAVENKFAALTPVRDIVVRGATTLTLTARPDAALADSKRKAIDAFSNL
jgi:hypothetical protein